MILRPYQEPIVRFVLQTKRGNVFAPMGLGKTSALLYSLEALTSLGHEALPALVLAPKIVAESTWSDQIKKHGFEFTCNPVIGSAYDRRKALSRSAQVYTINYENLSWLAEHLNGEWPFRSIIADESTRLKNYRSVRGGKRAKALSKYAFSPDVQRWINLTGTPTPNGVKDLWGQMWFIDAGKRLGRTYTQFMEMNFHKNYNGYGVELNSGAFKSVMDAIADVSLSVNIEDWINVAEPVCIEVPIKLPLEVMALYKQMEKQYIVSLTEVMSGDSRNIMAGSAAAMSSKCLQIAAGGIYDEAKESQELHDSKIQALASIIEEANGAPILVAYHFKADLVRLQKAFPKGEKLSQSSMAKWNKGDLQLMFIHPKSGGHGINLQYGGNILVFYSLDWNLEEHLQVVERIGPLRQIQAGFNRPVFIYYLLAEDTLDFVVKERLSSKRSVQDILLDFLSKYHGGDNDDFTEFLL